MPDPVEYSRRLLLSGLSVSTTMACFPTAAKAAGLIAQRPSLRVIIDNDFAGDPDGLVALAHQLLSAKTRVVLVTSSALDPKLSAASLAGKTAAAGRIAALRLMEVAGLKERPPVMAGAETFGLAASSGSSAIIAEAMREDALPLFIACGGPLTNVAAALRSEPRIAKRATLVWIGGGAYPAGEAEYNLVTDLDAARYVFEQSSVPIWQVAQPAYRQLQYSVAEMNADFRPISPLTAWLYERYLELPSWVQLGGSLTFGDSPLVLLTSLSAESSQFKNIVGREINANGSYGAELPAREIRVFQEVDQRLVLSDMLASFRMHASRSATFNFGDDCCGFRRRS